MLTLSVNLIFNIEWSIPAWILLVMHIVFDWRILWFWIALGVWILNTALWMHFIGFAAGCGEEKDVRENKNPYSVKNKNYRIK